MKSRMKSPALSVPGALDGLLSLGKLAAGELPRATIELVHLRASQINGCAVCVDMHSRALKKLSEPDERIFAVAAWREAPYYSEAERAALALTEATTRLSDRADPVPDDVWREATRHYSETELSYLLLSIALVNVWNRLNAATRQVSGAWTAQYV